MLAVKPLSAFAVLERCFSTAALPLRYHPGEMLSPGDEGNNDIIVLRKGVVRVWRPQRGVLLGILPAPLIIGLPGMVLGSREPYQLQAMVNCEGYRLEAGQAMVLLDQHHLWRDAFHWLTWQYRMLENRDAQLIGQNSYSQIRASLLTLESWEPSLRLRIGVLAYIQQRTRISRSVIAEVLAALRKGHYIEMERGKLTAVHRLPLEY